MPPKTSDELAAEKEQKPRPDLFPPRAVMAGGRAMAAGVAKHGGGRTGRGTYRDPGTDQSKPETHIASFERHWFRFLIGRASGIEVPIDPDSGLPELDCAMAQFGMVVDLVEDPVPLCISIDDSVSSDAYTPAPGEAPARAPDGDEWSCTAPVFLNDEDPPEQYEFSPQWVEALGRALGRYR